MARESHSGGRLHGQAVVITGAASGLGAATARRFAAEGASLLLADLQEDAGRALAAAPPDALFIKTDVSREEDVAALIDLARSQHERIDCMINNAGALGVVGPIHETDAAHWRATMAVLLDGVFFGVKHAARIMIPQRSGCILSTSSTSGVIAHGPHAYCAAKTAVAALTRSVAGELGPFGIRVNAVAPGLVATALTGMAMGSSEAAHARSAALSVLRRAIAAEDIAAGFAYLASEEARSVTGQVLVIDGGLTACPDSRGFHGDASRFVGTPADAR